MRGLRVYVYHHASGRFESLTLNYGSEKGGCGTFSETRVSEKPGDRGKGKADGKLVGKITIHYFLRGRLRQRP